MERIIADLDINDIMRISGQYMLVINHFDLI